MRIRLQPPARYYFILITLLAMLINLFTSRALLSVSLLLFLVATCVHPHMGKQLVRFAKTPVLLGMSLLFLMPFLSGIWSSHMREWSHIIRIKLPLLLLPLAFAGDWQLSKKHWRLVAHVFVLLIVMASGWSLSQYLANKEAIHAGYLQAKVIPTPLENDHVRFSWLVTAGVITAYGLLTTAKKRRAQLAYGIVIIALIVYLHILSARTGLLSFYLVLLLYGGWWLVKSKKIVRSVIVIAIVAALPLLAWYAFPTFQNRIRYFVYDFSYVKSQTYLPGANDGNRAQSLKAGWHILTHHPFGIGAGDVSDSTLHWYHTHIPHMLPGDQLVLPSSEWLIYGAAGGWLALIVFTGVMFVPLLTAPLKSHMAGWAIVLTAAASLAFDIGLEVQYGVFLYAFVVLWYWKWMSVKSNDTHELFFDRHYL